MQSPFSIGIFFRFLASETVKVIYSLIVDSEKQKFTRSELHFKRSSKSVEEKLEVV